MERVWTGKRVLERATNGDAAVPAAAAVAAGLDRAAFGALYDREAVRVYRYCLARLGDREAAEDATSQTFVSALAALPRYQERGNFTGWLFAIAHNAVADVQRRQRWLVPESGQERVDPDPTPEAAALGAEKVRELRALLVALPPAQRRALELRLAGLDGSEVAAAMGRSSQAVRLLQFRAIAKLRLLMGVAAGASKGDDDARSR